MQDCINEQTQDVFKYGRILFWGIGNVCRMCHLGHPELEVIGYIDSYYEKSEWNGKSVFRPDDIKDWYDKFTVITILHNNEIKKYLSDKGLVEGVDYSDFRDFFNVETTNPLVDLERISGRVYSEVLTNKTLLFAPIFMSRVTNELIHFFREYTEIRQQSDFVLMTGKSPISEKRAEELIGFHTICYGNEPEIKEKLYADENADKLCEILDGSEKEFVREINKKIGNGFEDNEREIKLLGHYGYYKKLIQLLNPNKIMIWGGWRRDTFYLEHIARYLGIPIIYLEHGVIPGTIQCDKEGIAGYGEIAKGSDEYNKASIDFETNEFDIVKNLIIHTKADTGVFRESEDDERQLSKLNKNNDTVFLVGTGYSGWDVEEGSIFWKEAVSSEVLSRREAYEVTRSLCKRNGWNLIYKPHPGSNDTFCDSDLSIDYIAIVKYKNIDELIEMSDIVVTLSTAVCYKVLFYEKPLVEIGKYLLWGKGCSYEVNGNYEELLQEALKEGMTVKQKEMFKEHILRLLRYNHWDDLTHPDISYGKRMTEDLV